MFVIERLKYNSAFRELVGFGSELFVNEISMKPHLTIANTYLLAFK